MGNGPWLLSSEVDEKIGVPVPEMSVQPNTGPPGSSLSIQE